MRRSDWWRRRNEAEDRATVEKWGDAKEWLDQQSPLNLWARGVLIQITKPKTETEIGDEYDMKLGEIFPSRFLTGKELTKPVTITVAYAVFEKMRDPGTGKEVEKPVVYAVGAKRGFIITKTMAGQLVKLFGNVELDSLRGKRFTIYQEQHKTGNMMICVQAAPAQTAPSPSNGHIEPAQVGDPVIEVASA